MKSYLILLLGLMSGLLFAQKLSFKSEIQAFQQELNKEYLTQETSPLRGDNFINFKKHPFFPVSEKYRVTAKLVRTKEKIVLSIPTSSGHTSEYIEFGKIYFKLNGLDQVLTLYTNDALSQDEAYKDYLFLPFRDETNGKDTYGGGRYLDLRIPEGDQLVVDFNKAYQPYCAYNAFDYSCPIVPESNRLKISVKAGVKYDDVYYH